MNEPLLQGDGYNPQQVGNPQDNVAGANALQPSAPVFGPPPAPPQAPPAAPIGPTAPPSVQGGLTRPAVQPVALNSTFNPYIGTRPSPSNPGVLEYYRKDQPQQGFSNPNDLYAYASQISGTPITSFSQLHGPIQNIQGSTQPGGVLTSADPNQAAATSAGTAGLSPDDLKNIASAENPLTQEQLDAILQGLGIPQQQAATFALPSQSSQQIFSDAYGAAGLADVRQKILDLNDQIAQRRNDLVAAQGQINENPFLSEASRVGRIDRLNTEAEQYIGNLTGQQQQLQNVYDQGVNEVNGVVTRHATDFATAQATNSAKLNYLLQQAEKQIGVKQSANQQAILKYLPDYLKAKATATTPTTFSTPDGAVYSFNRSTGKFERQAAPNAPSQVVPNAIPGLPPSVFNPATGTLGPAGSSSVQIPQNIQQGTGQPQLAYQNNNPGNLKFANQPGATMGANGFAKFSTPEAGYQAYLGQVQLDASRGLTLGQFVSKYAPPGENNTGQYLQQAMAATGATADTPLSQVPINKLAAFQLQKESGTQISQTATNPQAANQLLQSYVDKTPDGYQYVDQGKLEGTQKDAITYLARQAGIPILNTDEVAKVKAIQASELNLGNIQNAALGFLPSDPLSRVVIGPSNQLADVFQSNKDISAFKAWRSAVINNVQALAGGAGSGLRINQAEIDTALKNDLPEITDTAATAQQKIATLKSQLTTWKTVIFGTQPQANASAQADLSNLF